MESEYLKIDRHGDELDLLEQSFFVLEENSSFMQQVNAGELAIQDVLMVALEEQSKNLNQPIFISIVVCLVAGVIIVAMGWFFAKKLTRPIETLARNMANIANGKIDGDDLPVTSNDELSQLAKSFNQMQHNLRSRIEQDARISAENHRVLQALDKATASIALANAAGELIYCNRACLQLFANAEQDFQKQYGDFCAQSLTGMCITHLCPQLEIQNLGGERIFEFSVDTKQFKVIASPVFSDDEELTGIVLEWQDRTTEIQIEQEVQSIVSFASAGEFDHRISTDNTNGFFATLGESVNALVDVIEQITHDAIRVFGALSEGRLDQTIDYNYQGGFKRLKDDANTTVSSLTEVVTNIQASSQAVNAGAASISSGNKNLSQRTSEQESSLQDTAKNMDRINTTVQKTADNANQANQMALTARTQAIQGGKIVQDAIRAMREINNASTQISEIITVIDEIAFQTNLLALNASVEAARAGEHGRGFAVVAGEVRNLAGRSATAAKEIKELIENSAQKVNTGSEMVSHSGEALQEIVSCVESVTTIIGEIASVANQQSGDISVVHQSIERLQALTLQNTAMVQSAATASQDLGEQADSLNQLIAFFNAATNKSALQRPLQAVGEK